MSPLFGGKHDDEDARPNGGDDEATTIQAEIARLAHSRCQGWRPR